ncbi:MAG: hypothetical protein ABL895_03925, partial [Cyclobacteriaceae bacterium]
MKTNVLLLIAGLVLSSCDILVVEPMYDERDRVTGSYRIEEYSQTYNESIRFSIYIRKTGSGYNSREVMIENFYNAGVDVRAEISSGKIFIPQQFVNGYEIEGVGSLYLNEIQFNYRVRDTYTNRTTDFCEATAWLN